MYKDFYFLLMLMSLSIATQAQQPDSLNSNKLDEVVITGQYKAQSLKKSVYQVKIISAEQLKQMSATEIKQVLNHQLGIRFSPDGATGINNMELMGLSGAGIKVLWDGMPMMDRGTAKESLSQIDLNVIERIEIIEGPLSVIYGTDAMAGVINFISKKNSLNRFSLQARVQEESAGKQYQLFNKAGSHQLHLNTQYNKNGLNLSASASRNNFGGWKNNTQERANDWLPKDQIYISAQAALKRKLWQLSYRVNLLDENIYLLGNINPLTCEAADKTYHSQRQLHQLQGLSQLSNVLQLELTASLTNYQRKTQSTNLNIDTGAETLSLDQAAQDRDEFKHQFIRSSFLYTPQQAWAIQAGLEYNGYQANGNRIVGSPIIHDYALFLSAEWQALSFLKLKPGFRMLKNSVYQAPPFLPSVHAKIQLNPQLQWRMAYAKGYRAPILRELYFSFKDASHDISGNADLKAEHSHSFNTSFTYNWKNTDAINGQVSFNSFYNTYKQRIDIAADAQQNNAYRYLNIEDYKTTGFEFQQDLKFNNIKFNAGINYLGRYNQYFKDQSVYGESPQFTWSLDFNAGISYKLQKIDAQFALYYKYAGAVKQYFIDQSLGNTQVSLGSLEAHQLLDFNASKNINKYISVNAGLRNILNVTQVRQNIGNNTAHNAGNSIPLQYGRSYYLGLQFQWN